MDYGEQNPVEKFQGDLRQVLNEKRGLANADRRVDQDQQSFHVSAGNTEGQELEGSDAMDDAAATGVRTVHEQDKHSQKSAMVQPNAGFNIGHNQVNASKESDGSCSNVQKGNRTLTVEARPSNMILHDKDGYTNKGDENWSVKEDATGFKEMFTEAKNSQKIALEQYYDITLATMASTLRWTTLLR
ncbi:hypothetical protein A4A49_62207, partial [Nicotiana attenuata]